MTMGGVNAVGSVVSMTVPTQRWFVQRYGSVRGMSVPPVGEPMDVAAFGVIVIARDMWVMTTRVEPLVMCCGGIVPFESHMAGAHEDQSWSLRIRE